MKIAKSITELIGHTPLLRMENWEKKHNSLGKIIAKLEYFNPGGSAKDRIAVAMIDDAQKKGLLKKGGTIIEPTSGNTGVGLALVAAARGYKMILTMPETMSVERRKLLSAYGAQVVLTDGAKGMNGAIAKAEELKNSTEGAIILGQFTNEANPDAHFRTTAEEIWEDTDGKVDIFVAGVGTGGTVSGVGKGLKAHNPAVQVVAVEPFGSPFLSKGVAGKHKIQGIGAGFAPKTFNSDVVDKIMTVTDQDALCTSRSLAADDGVLVGISSGAAMWAATYLSSLEQNKGKNIVVLLPDTGERYLSTELFTF
ncbi:MAG: cysteine synthase A [Flavobacteriales bacterium]|nr:cysteine synthase A [Flavobacteriales bacterium]